MRITRLDLKGFGRFSQQVLGPGPGLNLVYGPNESGKSTLMAFVHAMFFGLRGGRRARQGELSALRRYEPWSGGPYQGILWYELANGDAFRVGRNFARGTVHLQDAHHNDISGHFALDRETGPLFAQAQLGLDGDAFLHSVMVRQSQTVLEPAARRNLMDSLIRMRELGQEVTGFRQAETALKQALLERVGSARSTVRPLDRILERLETLEREAGEVRRQDRKSVV
jgi:DNA repair exonuclease SbcCD ATPase subunit